MLGVDEKSFQGRDFVTVVCDLDTGTVLHVADGRGSAALLEYYGNMTPEQREAVAAVAMDMHQPYLLATELLLPDATIVFDKVQPTGCGTPLFPGMVWLGDPQSLDPDETPGPDVAESAAHLVELVQMADHQRGDRGLELEDSVDQVHGPGLRKSRRISSRHLFSLRGPQFVPTGNLEEPASHGHGLRIESRVLLPFLGDDGPVSQGLVILTQVFDERHPHAHAIPRGYVLPRACHRSEGAGGPLFSSRNRWRGDWPQRSSGKRGSTRRRPGAVDPLARSSTGWSVETAAIDQCPRQILRPWVNEEEGPEFLLAQCAESPGYLRNDYGRGGRRP
jgi:hypothetical protein